MTVCADDVSIPEFKLVFQQPTYLLEKDIEKSEYICDETKTECRVNFTLTQLDEKDLSTKYICEIDFGFTTGEEHKCNPNTVIFPEGESTVIFKVSLKSTPDIIEEKTVIIKNRIMIVLPVPSFPPIMTGSEDATGSLSNTGITENISTGSLINTGTLVTTGSVVDTGIIENTGGINEGTGTLLSTGIIDATGTVINTGIVVETQTGMVENGSGGVENSQTGTLLFPKPFIEVQSGLSFLTGSTWKCKSASCSVNLTAEQSFTGIFEVSKYNCKWSFSGGTFTTSGTDTICNPGYVHYGTGEFEITLTIIEKSNSFHFQSAQIILQNFVIANTTLQNTVIPTLSQNQNSGGGGQVNHPPTAQILLQTKDSASKTMSGNVFVCETQSTCSINVTGEHSSDIDGDILSFFWDFGNGQESFQRNPASVKYGTGEYEIHLKVMDEQGLSSRDTFLLKVIEKVIPIEEKKVKKALVTSLSGTSETVDTQEKYMIFSGVISRVVDGDTVVMHFENGHEEKVRLIGIDTPETHHPYKPIGFFGYEAEVFTRSFLEGKSIVLKVPSSDSRDKYGRLLGYIYRDDIFFNQLLVELGYARVYTYFPFEYSREFVQAEKRAKKIYLGVWSEKNVADVSPYDILQIVEVNAFDNSHTHYEDDPLDEKTYTFYDYLYRYTHTKQPKKEQASEDKRVKNIPHIPLTRSIILQKKALKFSGKTLPFAQIVITGLSKDIIIKSDKTGKYTFKLDNNLFSGNYSLHYQVIDASGSVFDIEKEKFLVLTPTYLKDMKKHTPSKVKKTKQKKVKIEKIKISTPIKNERNFLGFKEKVPLWVDVFTGVFVVSGGIFILRRKKIL